MCKLQRDGNSLAAKRVALQTNDTQILGAKVHTPTRHRAVWAVLVPNAHLHGISRVTNLSSSILFIKGDSAVFASSISIWDNFTLGSKGKT